MLDTLLASQPVCCSALTHILQHTAPIRKLGRVNLCRVRRLHSRACVWRVTVTCGRRCATTILRAGLSSDLLIGPPAQPRISPTRKRDVKLAILAVYQAASQSRAVVQTLHCY
jgi:hypothetical protein